MATIQTTYLSDRVTRIINAAHPGYALELLGGKKFGPIVHAKKDKNSLSQKWRIKNLEKEGGSGEFVVENVAVPGSYITVTAFTVGAPVYGSPDATVWIKQVTSNGRSWFATAYEKYRFGYVTHESEFAPAALLPPWTEPKATPTKFALFSAPTSGFVFEDDLVLGHDDE